MKKLAIILLALAMLLTLAACAAKPANDNKPAETDKPTDVREWKITVVTASGDIEFTSADAAKLTPVTMDVTTTNKEGVESTATYTGVKLSDILSKAGVTDFANLTIASSDGFAVDYDRELALMDDTILAWERDGELMDGDYPLRMVPKTGTNNQSVKNAAQIIVND